MRNDLTARLLLSFALLGVGVGTWNCGGSAGDAASDADDNPVAASTPTGSEDASAQALVRMNWRMTDRCADGKGLQWRLFDKSDNRTRFPKTGVFRVRSGAASTKAISCASRHLICFGGTTDPPSSAYFGVGIKGNQGCSRCCTLCRPATVGVTISCGRRLAGDDAMLGMFDDAEGEDAH